MGAAICTHCGQAFEALRSTAQYCGHACRQAAYLARRPSGPCDANDARRHSPAVAGKEGQKDAHAMGFVSGDAGTLSLVLTPALVPGRFEARLDGELIVTSRKPLVDGARELLARGHDPAALLTMRHAGSVADSFPPQPIGEWARWTYEEGPGGLKRREWTSFVDGTAPSAGDAKEALHGEGPAVGCPEAKAPLSSLPVTLTEEAA